MQRSSIERLGVFFGTLVVLAALLQTVSWMTGVPMGSLGVVYMFTPMVAGLVVVYRSDIAFADLGVRVGRVRWLAGGVLAGLSIVGLTVVLSVLVPGVSLDLSAVRELVGPSEGIGLLFGFGMLLVVGLTVGAVMAFGEEFGWRGYLLWELAPLGFWKASLAIGAVWGLWHLPSVLEGGQYPSFPLVGIVMMTAACIALSPVYTYVVWRSESVFAAVFLHGIFNGASMTVIPFLTAENVVLAELVATPLGIAGMVACGVLAVGIKLTGVPNLSRGDVGSSARAVEQPVRHSRASSGE